MKTEKWNVFLDGEEMKDSEESAHRPSVIVLLQNQDQTTENSATHKHDRKHCRDSNQNEPEQNAPEILVTLNVSNTQNSSLSVGFRSFFPE